MQLQQPGRDIYSVSRLTREVRSILEGSFTLIWIEGEISNLARPTSGHLYFSLKDGQSQVRCAMFRTRNSLLKFEPENGLKVLIHARVSLYEGRGEFQLIAERMEPAGEGALQLAYEQLKERLQSEGLFDDERKKSLPEFPQRVGVITSATGAAIKDILSVLQRRFPALSVIVYPTLVQGEGAAASIATAIITASERQECDVLIVSRGGGSLEDLWAFNEEVVARSIHACKIPVVSGVGHEIDFTIADFVADVRAPTPSASAELISPDQEAMRQDLRGYAAWFKERLDDQIERARTSINYLQKRLVHPGRRLQDLAQRLDDLNLRMLAANKTVLHAKKLRLLETSSRLKQVNPAQQLMRYRQQLQQHKTSLNNHIKHQLVAARAGLNEAAHALNTVSPLATLERGYSIVCKGAGEEIIRTIKDIQPGDKVNARVTDGEILCVVEEAVKK